MGPPVFADAKRLRFLTLGEIGWCRLDVDGARLDGHGIGVPPREPTSVKDEACALQDIRQVHGKTASMAFSARLGPYPRRQSSRPATTLAVFFFPPDVFGEADRLGLDQASIPPY